MRKNPDGKKHQQKDLAHLNDQRYTVKPNRIFCIYIKKECDVKETKNKSDDVLMPLLKFIDEITIQYHGNNVCMYHHSEHVRVRASGNFFIEGCEKFIVPGRIAKVGPQETEDYNITRDHIRNEILIQHL